MEHHTQEKEGILETCTCEGGSGVLTLIYTILALGFLLSVIIFG